MKENIRKLVILQAVDTRIKALDEGMANNETELQKRESALVERKTAITELAEKKDAIDRRKRELEAEIDVDLQRIKDRQGKVMDVQTNREHQSLLREIETCKKANKTRENEIIQLMEESERLFTTLQELTNLSSAEEKLLEEEIAQVEQQKAVISSQRVEMEEERQLHLKEIPTALMSKYELLLSRRNGKAIVETIDAVCQGCFMNIQPQLFNQIMIGNSLVFCPNCQRILYYQQPSEEK